MGNSQNIESDYAKTPSPIGAPLTGSAQLERLIQVMGNLKENKMSDNRQKREGKLMSVQQTVFIVDDDDFFRSTLKKIFQSAGFYVATFDRAERFLAEYTSCEESCLILDLRMPEIGGLELLRCLQERHIDLPVIIYTGNADVQVAVCAMQNGAFSVIEKPLSSELLIEQARAAISSARPQRARNARITKAQAEIALLTEREKEVAKCLADGLSAAEAACKLGISARTVEAHRGNLFRKLHINSVSMLVHIVLLAELGE